MSGTRAVEREDRRKMNSEERRQQIVTLAAKLFDEAGYANTSMADIAEKVGVAKPTLYHYFVSKDVILHAIHEEFIDLLISRHEARQHLNMQPEQQLLGIMTDVLELMDTHPGHVRVFFEHYRELAPDAQQPIRAKRLRYEQAVDALFDELRESGRMRPTAPKLPTYALFGMCNWAYQWHSWYRANGGARTQDIAAEFWTYLMHGLLVPST